MSTAAELARLLGSLASRGSVYARSGSAAGRSLAAEVHAVVLLAEKEWAGHAVKGAAGRAVASEVADALAPVSSAQAVELITNLSADDLVFPGLVHRDREHARRAAERVVKLLGRDAMWLTNLDGAWHNGRAWNPVTMYTFDGVIAGISNELFAVLLQVGED